MKNKKTLDDQVSDLRQRVSALEDELDSSNVPVDSKRKIFSEKEYLLEKNPKSAVEKTLSLGAYLEKHKGMASFTVDDLRNAFRAAREPLPANINDMINKNIKKGFFMEAQAQEDKKAWMLTATGEKAVKGKINKN